jgi:hypothetical protein
MYFNLPRELVLAPKHYELLERLLGWQLQDFTILSMR